MKLEAHEQPLVFVKDALSRVVHAKGVSRLADDCRRGHACNFCPEEMHCRIDKPAHNKKLIVRRQRLWNRFSSGLRECFCSS
jgi:hypothetical protein